MVVVVRLDLPACPRASQRLDPATPSPTLSVEQSRAGPRLHARHAARPARPSLDARCVLARAPTGSARPPWTPASAFECTTRVHGSARVAGVVVGRGKSRGEGGRAAGGCEAGWALWSERVCVHCEVLEVVSGWRTTRTRGEGEGPLCCAALGRGKPRRARRRRLPRFSSQSRLSLLTAPCSQSAGQC